MTSMKPLMYSIGRLVTAAALVTGIGLGAGVAAAVDIDSCSQACAVDCNALSLPPGVTCVTAVDFGDGPLCLVDSDIGCGVSDSGILLYGGVDLLFTVDGKLSCATGVICNDAVVIQSPGSKVTSNTSGLGEIRGQFRYGVNCQGQDGSEVDSVRIVGGLISVIDCETVTNNIFEGLDRQYLTVNRGAVWTRKANSGSGPDKASGNLIRDKVWSVTVSGTAKVEFADNTLLTSHNNSVAFLVSSGAQWKVRNNRVLGSGDTPRSQYFYHTNPVIFSGPLPSGAFSAESGNICNVDDHPGCASCMSLPPSGRGACLDYIPH